MSSSGFTRKRISKACSNCRVSKTKCDEQRPVCGRCQTLPTTADRPCEYLDRPKTAHEQKIDELQAEVLALKEQLGQRPQDLNYQNETRPQMGRQTGTVTQASLNYQPEISYQSSPNYHPTPNYQPERARPPGVVVSPAASATQSLSTVYPAHSNDRLPAKRRRIDFGILVNHRDIPDFVTEGIINNDQAAYYHECFFAGSDRFVPIFDKSDTFQSIRGRNGLLFNAICAVGCGASRDTTTESRTLHVRLKRWLSTVILSPNMHCLEAVQALLVTACWMPENNIVIAVAMRMALELQLADSFDKLLDPSVRQSGSPEAHQLMKHARTWFALVVLAKILQVDAGDLLGLSIKNVRRCRSLLNQPYSTALDMRLFSQVELNHLRAKISTDLLAASEELADAVAGARLDLSIWHDDWKRIVATSPLAGAEMPSLLTNLAIQWHWADAMTSCTAFRLSGSPTSPLAPNQRSYLTDTKSALHAHLDTMLASNDYLDNFKYAMDFVWAKGTYCFLLLLKLSFLLEDTAAQHTLLEQGQALHDRLTTVAGQGRSKIYLQLLAFALSHHMSASQGASPAVDDFVADEFVFDWDFPVLNLSDAQGTTGSLEGWLAVDDEHFLMETLEGFWAQTAGDSGMDSRRSGSRNV